MSETSKSDELNEPESSDTIVDFFHKMSAKQGIIYEGKFQPTRFKTKENINLPKKSKKMYKGTKVGEFYAFEENISPEAIIDEEIRAEILAMGIDKFKSLPFPVIQNYFRALENTSETANMKKQELIAYLFRRLGISKVEPRRE